MLPATLVLNPVSKHANDAGMDHFLQQRFSALGASKEHWERVRTMYQERRDSSMQPCMVISDVRSGLHTALAQPDLHSTLPGYPVRPPVQPESTQIPSPASPMVESPPCHPFLIPCDMQEPHRHYHTLSHIAHMLAFLDAAVAAGVHLHDTAAVTWAVLYHDVVYDPAQHGGTNERQSAALAREHLTHMAACEERIAAVEHLILATVRHELPPSIAQHDHNTQPLSGDPSGGAAEAGQADGEVGCVAALQDANAAVLGPGAAAEEASTARQGAALAAAVAPAATPVEGMAADVSTGEGCCLQGLVAVGHRHSHETAAPATPQSADTTSSPTSVPSPLTDCKLFLDADLSVLGGTTEEYDTYAAGIALEYGGLYSREEYCAGRARVLRSFLNRPALYFTDYARDKLEGRARANLERELAVLEGSR